VTLFVFPRRRSVQLFAALPMPPPGESREDADRYMGALNAMSRDLPPLALVRPGQNMTFISTAV